MNRGRRKHREPETPATDAEAIEAVRRFPEAHPDTGRGETITVSEALDTEPIDTETPEAEGSSGGFVSHIQNVAGPVAGAIGSVIEMATQGVSLRQAVIERRLRRLARDPLPNLYELYPDSRLATPHELGFRFVPVEEIRGTAVAGAAQRGGDFLPLKPFRGENWEARWQRIRWAGDTMQPLPPVDLIKYDGDYWVVDGHNRVAATLYANGTGLDAMVTELVPLDGQTSERPRNLLAYFGEMGELRTGAQSHQPVLGMRQIEQKSSDAAILLPAGEAPIAHDDEVPPPAETEPGSSGSSASSSPSRTSAPRKSGAE